MSPQAGSGRLSAVFVLDITHYTGPLLAGWLEAGHRIDAIVVPGYRQRPKHFSTGNLRRRLKRGFLLKRYIGNTAVRLVEFGRPYDWGTLGGQLSEFKADVLICFAFPALIPHDVLGCFPKGGLNLHPALLPNYRGPHPLHRLAVDGQHAVHGGVTLHRMSDSFDDGDILGQVSFSEADWVSLRTLIDSVATAMRMLVSEVAPAYCKGSLSGMRQPVGDFVWARLDAAHTMISPAMSIEHVARLWHVLGTLPGIYLDVAGRKVRLGLQIRRLGPPTGQAPFTRWGIVEFDLADGRVQHLTYGRLLKRLSKWYAMLTPSQVGKSRHEIKLFYEPQNGPTR
ncbi:formyltransferase family protein [Mesorhizobium huakuii]|uniref:Formyltransferase family protein n=1 Tax=Mesorhizobium huakuii TaxID=28104 RepID=A0ABZ0VVL2_9HYPH|nr:formyltransferase family protein [Mesorhizobium huakuii]WQC00275.1 formyltransferase family protein [Mesorhizobium huakuii]